MPVSDRHQEYALRIQEQLVAQDIRAEADLSGNTIAYQIRNAVKKKIPYVIVIGDKEIENNYVSVRLRNSEQINDISLADFMERVSAKIKNKSIDL